MPEDKKPKRPPLKAILVEARMHRHPKIAALPSDSCRWAWLVILMEAKWQTPEGQFANMKHLRACIGNYARHIPRLRDMGLLDISDGIVRVHDWEHYQYESSTARVKRWRSEKTKLRLLEGNDL